jgi:NADPH:quinone reductase-like Zn-dependent oxidoreductase
VNYKTQDFASVVKEVTNNRGVDIIIDFVGQSHWNKNLDSMALDGTMVCLAQLSGEFTIQSMLSNIDVVSKGRI